MLPAGARRRDGRRPRNAARRGRAPAPTGPAGHPEARCPLALLFTAMVLAPLGAHAAVRPSGPVRLQHQGIQPGYTLSHYGAVLSDSYFLEIFWRTLWISALTTICVR